MKNSQSKVAGVSLVLLLLGGCATVPQDAGMSNVQQIVDDTMGIDSKALALDPDNALTIDQVNTLLLEPLDLTDAELIAIQTNPLIKTSILQWVLPRQIMRRPAEWRTPVFLMSGSLEKHMLRHSCLILVACC